MIAWTAPELDSLDRAREMRIAGRRRDGWLRTLARVWHVVVEDTLYIRSSSSAGTPWHHGTPEHANGAIRWDGLVRQVTCTLDGEHSALVDAAYAAKCGEEPDYQARTTPGRCDTVRIDPR